MEAIHNTKYTIKNENEYNDYIFAHTNVISQVNKIGTKYFIKESVETQ